MYVLLRSMCICIYVDTYSMYVGVRIYFILSITQCIKLCVKNMCVQSTCRLKDISNSALVYA